MRDHDADACTHDQRPHHCLILCNYLGPHDEVVTGRGGVPAIA